METIRQKNQENGKYHNLFQTFEIYFGLLANDQEGTLIHGYETISKDHQYLANTIIHLKEEWGGCYGYVQSGSLKTSFNGETIKLNEGTWFSTEKGLRGQIQENSRVFIVQKNGYRGFTTLGMTESQGRLKYINECYDTLLSSPIKKGLPCINSLHIPTGVHQQIHTHPSTRAGIIFSGKGVCETFESSHSLSPGTIFFLPKDGWHKFRTDVTYSTLGLFAFHPDSDFGPDDDDHPMLNRTLVNGESAKSLDPIRTK